MSNASSHVGRPRRTDLTETQQQFVVWLCTPRVSRHPQTLDELAVSLGTSRITLWRWKKDPLIQTAVDEMVRDMVGGPERVATIIDRIYQSGLNGDNKAAELFMKYAGLLRNDANVTVRQDPGSDIGDMSDEELKEVVRNSARELEEST